MTRRSLIRSLAAGALMSATLALTACGSSGPALTLNTAKVERAIAQSSLAQRGIYARVTCPSRVRQEKGLAFSCTAVAARGSARFVVTQLDGSGHVHYDAP